MALSIKEFSSRKAGKGFEFLPKHLHALEFEPILEKMHRHSMTITVESNDFITTRFLKARITLFKSARTIIENAKTSAHAKKIFAKFLAKIT